MQEEIDKDKEQGRLYFHIIYQDLKFTFLSNESYIPMLMSSISVIRRDTLWRS